MCLFVYSPTNYTSESSFASFLFPGHGEPLTFGADSHPSSPSPSLFPKWEPQVHSREFVVVSSFAVLGVCSLLWVLYPGADRRCGAWLTLGHLHQVLSLAEPGSAWTSQRHLPRHVTGLGTLSPRWRSSSVSAMTDVLTEASNWMVSANKPRGETERRVGELIFF